jgi:cell division control protein 7
MNEIVIMETCRGCRHVAQLITAFRHEDQVLVVMPYQKSEEFKVSRSWMSGGIID